jgi:hypothetical protein
MQSQKKKSQPYGSQITVCSINDACLALQSLIVMAEKVKATIASIKEAFEADPPNLAGAKILSVQLKYWQGLEDAAKEWVPSKTS